MTPLDWVGRWRELDEELRCCTNEQISSPARVLRKLEILDEMGQLEHQVAYLHFLQQGQDDAVD